MIDSALERLKQVHSEENSTEIESAMDQLNEAWAAASEDLQKAYQEAAQAEAGGDGAPADDAADDDEEVKDVDFEVVDEEEEK